VKTKIIPVVLTTLTAALFVASAQQPSCNRCSATYIPQSEVQAYSARGKAQNITDQQIRAVDIGKAT
jgi:hypothetical protein